MPMHQPRPPAPRPGRRLSARTFVAALAIGTTLVGCRPTGDVIGPSPAANAARVIVHPGSIGTKLEPATSGLTFEVAELASETFGSPDLVAHVRALGHGLVRFGGSSADAAFWTSHGEHAPAWARTVLTPTSLDRLAAFARATERQVVLTVNLRHLDPARAADEVRYARSVLGRSLQGVAVGDEPDLYYADAAQYVKDLRRYTAAITKADGRARFIGPDAAGKAGFPSGFVAAEKATRDIDAFSRHYAPTTACDGKSTSIGQLFAPPTFDATATMLQNLAREVSDLRVPAELSEVTAVSCGGQKGVTDTLAGALWNLDHVLAAASTGVSHVDFAASTIACDQARSAGSPFCADQGAGGALRFQPGATGLQAVSTLRTGAFARVDNPAAARVHAYAIRSGHRLTMVLVNLDDPGAHDAQPIGLRLDKHYRSVHQVVLRSGSGRLGATDAITLGGQPPSATEPRPTPASTTLHMHHDDLALDLAPATAVILTFSS